MKSKITVCLLLVLAMVMTGCSGSVQVDTPNEPANEVKEETVEEEAEKPAEEEAAVSESTEEEAEVEENASDNTELRNLQMVSEYYHDYKMENEEPYTLFAYVKTLCPALTDEEAEEFPELSAAMDDLFGSIISSAVDTFEELAEGAERDYNEASAEYFQTNFCERRTQINRADTNVVSFLHVDSDYYGGNHPNTEFNATVLDTKTGKTVEINDIVKDMDKLEEYFLKALPERYPDTNFFDLENDVHTFCTETPEMLQFTVDHGFVTFYFSTYALAPFSDGAQWIAIGFDEVDGLLTDTYNEYPEDYAIPFVDNSSVYVSTDDGYNELFFFSAPEDPDDEYSAITYTVNYGGEVYSDNDTYFYQDDPTYVRKGGKDYLYVLKYADNDWKDFDVIDLNGGKIKKIKEESVGLASYETDNSYYDDCWRSRLLTDPDDFITSTILQNISTLYTLTKSCVADDGTIEQIGDYSDVETKLKLTLTQDATFNEVDPDTAKKIGDKELKEGDVITVERIYSYEEVYCVTEDGSAIMLDVKTGDWPNTVNGIDVEELFDGTCFAG